MTDALDLVVAVGLFASFAALVTAHVHIAVGLASCEPRWRAFAAMLPPSALLAPYWAYREGMRGRVIVWGLSAAAYAVCSLLAYR